MKKVFYLFLILLIAAGACSIKKRAYRPGYHIDWVFKKNKINPTSLNEKQIVSKKPEIADEIRIFPGNNDPDLLSSVNNNISLSASLKRKRNSVLKDSTCGDVITFRKGYEVVAKIYEINETQIKYRRCDNLNGPLIIVNKNDVFSVKYPNGFIDVFTKSVNEYTNDFHQQREVPGVAIATLGFTIGILFGSVISALIGVILAPIAKRKILSNPDKYKGLNMVNTCATICWIVLVLTVFLILLVLHFAGVI